MNYKQIERIEIETGCKAIEFDDVDGLYVFLIRRSNTDLQSLEYREMRSLIRGWQNASPIC